MNLDWEFGKYNTYSGDIVQKNQQYNSQLGGYNPLKLGKTNIKNKIGMKHNGRAIEYNESFL